MAEKRVLFRCDANSKIGMGHLVRSTALADMLDGYSRAFLYSDSSPELVREVAGGQTTLIHVGERDEVAELATIAGTGSIIVLDGYQFDSDYQRQLVHSGCKLVVIDDFAKGDYFADVIINQSAVVKNSDYNVARDTMFCLGPGYALLRRPFLAAARKSLKKADKIERIFISFGGADSADISYSVLKAISRFNFTQITVLTGAVNENVKRWQAEFASTNGLRFLSNLSATEVCAIMEESDLAICPASSLSLELCAVGTFMIFGITADNQQGLYNSMCERNLGIPAGRWQDLSVAEIEKLINVATQTEMETRYQYLQQQRTYIDGKSDERLRTVFSKLLA